MFSIARVLITFLFIFSLFSGFALSQSISEADEVAIKSVVTQFFNLYAKKDSSAVSALWSEKSQFLGGHKQELERIFAGAEQIESKNLAFGKIEVEGENVKIRANVEFK